VSGVLYQQAGVSASLWGAVLLAGAAGIAALFLPPVTAPAVSWAGAKGDEMTAEQETGVPDLPVAWGSEPIELKRRSDDWLPGATSTATRFVPESVTRERR
jgi:hypothetical protein